MSNNRLRCSFFLFIACVLTASIRASALPAACGKDDVQFSVKTKNAVPEPLTADQKVATVVFIEDVGGEVSPAPTIRFGADGAWVGATRGKSYFVYSVIPGKHSLCGSRQGGARADRDNVAVAPLTAEAGKVYFFSFKITRIQVGDAELAGGGGLPGNPGNANLNVRERDGLDTVSFTPLPEDQAREQVKRLPMSFSSVK